MPESNPTFEQIDDDLEKLQEEFSKEMEQLQKEFSDRLQRQRTEFRSRLESARDRLKEIESDSREQLEQARARMKEMAAQLQRLELENEKLQKELMTYQLSGSSATQAPGKLGLSIVPADDAVSEWVGVSAADLSVVSSIEPAGTAAQMGLKTGDVLVEVEGVPASSEALIRILGEQKFAGDGIVMKWARKGPDGVMQIQGRGRLQSADDEIRSVETTDASVVTDEEESSKPGVSMGISVLQQDDFGIEVTEVESGSNAAAAGLIAGDVMTAVGDARIRTVAGLRDILQRTQPGSQIEIAFRREGLAWISTVKLGSEKTEAEGLSLERASTVAGFLGIVPTVEEGGLLIEEVITGSCAESMGLRSGDRLIAVNGRTISDIGSLRTILTDLRAGDSIVINYSRGAGERMEAKGVLGVFPAEDPQSKVIPENKPSVALKTSVVTSKASPEVLVVESERVSRRDPLGVVVVWTEAGVIVERVLSGSLAEEAGIEVGDRLIRIEESSIDSLMAISEALSDRDNFGVTVEVERGLNRVQLMTRPMPAVASIAEFSAPVPASMALSAPEDLFLGLDVEENAIGILVTGIVEGFSASEGGLEPGDWIIRICGSEVRTIEDLKTIFQYQGLDSIEFTVRRGLETLELTIPLVLPE